MRGKSQDIRHIISGILLISALIAIVFWGGAENRAISEAQGAEYLEQAAERSAEEMEKTFIRQEENIQTMAHMTAHIMEYEYLDTERMIHLTETSSFDGIEFIHESGKCYSMNGTHWDVSGKAYFQDAMNQKAGYAFDEAPERGEKNCIVFYSPIIKDDGTFEGILVGYWRQETAAAMLDTSFWGHSARQFLCTADGTVIASNMADDAGKDIADVFAQYGSMTEAEKNIFTESLEQKKGRFDYAVKDKTEIGMISSFGNQEFMIVDTFPGEVLAELYAPMYSTMRIAFCMVGVSLAAYIIWLILINTKRKKQLEAENRKISTLLEDANVHANKDSLTGLLNRRGMEDAVQTAEYSSLAALIIDIDYFKKINDTYGHQTGDRLLIKTAQQLKKVFPVKSVLVRLGGDEFAVILFDCNLRESEQIRQKIDHINQNMKAAHDGLPSVSISAGAAFSESGVTEELMLHADSALYEAKRRGRCCCCIYDEGSGEI